MKDFRPARFLVGGHAQTIWPHFFRRVPPIAGLREVWTVREASGELASSDRGRGDAVADDIDVVLLPDRVGRPGVILMHGLEARAESTYMRGFLHAIAAAEWNGIAVNFPSCGPSAASQRGLYHAGQTDHLVAIIERVRARWQTDVIGAIGVSLGGNVLLKYLGEAGAAAALNAVVAISVPFDLGVCAARLDAPGIMPWVYRERFLRTLRRKVQRLARHPGSPLHGQPAGWIRQIRTFTSFDEHVTAPLFGFVNAHDYWRRNSSNGFLDRIERPALLISAKDDPFVGSDCIPTDAISKNPWLTLRLPDHGGHVGFVGGSIVRPDYAVDDAALSFLAAHLRSDSPDS